MEKPNPEGAEEGHNPRLLSSPLELMSPPQKGHPESAEAVQHPTSPAALAKERETQAEPLIPLCNLLNALQNQHLYS